MDPFTKTSIFGLLVWGSVSSPINPMPTTTPPICTVNVCRLLRPILERRSIGIIHNGMFHSSSLSQSLKCPSRTPLPLAKHLEVCVQKPRRRLIWQSSTLTRGSMQLVWRALGPSRPLPLSSPHQMIRFASSLFDSASFSLYLFILMINATIYARYK